MKEGLSGNCMNVDVSIILCCPGILSLIHAAEWTLRSGCARPIDARAWRLHAIVANLAKPDPTTI